MKTLRPAVAVGVVLALGLYGSVIAAGSAGALGHAGRAGAGGPAGAGGVLPPDQAWTVTLITGDVVRVRTVRGGPPLVSVQPRPGRGNAIFSKFISPSGQIDVLPQDVVPLLGRVLDPALFDVTTLIANGDDNAHRSYLPLVVQAQAGRRAAAAVTTAGLVLPPGTRPSRTHPMTAREPQTSAARVGRALAAMSAAVLRGGRVTQGIRHIWLARTVRAAGGTQIGAGAAPAVTLTLKATPIPGTARGHMGAYAWVVNIGNPALFDQEVPIPGTARVRVPAGRYWISGDINDLTNPNEPRAAWTGQPEVAVTRNTTVALDGAATVPVTGLVTGHPTVMTSVGFHVVRHFAGRLFGGLAGGDVFAFGPNVSHDLFAQPTGTARNGSFHVFTDFQLSSPTGTAKPYVYDLFHPVGPRVPRSLAYTATPAEQATFARFNERFYGLDGSTAPVLESRYGMTPIGLAAGYFTVQDAFMVPGGTALTEYVSTGPGIRWNEEVAPPFTIGGKNLLGDWVILVPGWTRYTPGSQHTVDWVRQPFRPGPYSGTKFSPSGCVPRPTVRFPGEIHVELTELQNRPDGFDCLSVIPQWLRATSRTMRLYRGSQLIGTAHSWIGDFLVPAAPGRYKLVYRDDSSAVLPVSTQTRTTWTFRSAAPASGIPARIPLLLVGYALPLNLGNHPDGSTARFTVARVAGTPPAKVTGFRLWTSLDNGHTWQPAPVRALGGGRFAATLPPAAPGQAVSLRARATDAGGSGIDQTIMAAYHG